jgi:hypothetical protein
MRRVVQTENDLLGVLVTDSNGMCIRKQGDADTKASGYIGSLSRRVDALTGAGDENRPTILIETDQKRIIIQRQGQIIVTLNKKHAQPVQQE